MKKSVLNTPVHPIVVFWLGVLTGAVLVALVFGYKMLDAVDYENRVIRYTPMKATVETDYAVKGVTVESASKSLDSSDVMWGGGGGNFVPTTSDVMWGGGGGNF